GPTFLRPVPAWCSARSEALRAKAIHQRVGTCFKLTCGQRQPPFQAYISVESAQEDCPDTLRKAGPVLPTVCVCRSSTNRVSYKVSWSSDGDDQRFQPRDGRFDDI